MANIKNENVKVKAKIFDNDVTIKGNVGTKDVKIKSNINIVPSATTEHKGIIRIATDEEAIEGVSTNTAITPHTLKKVTNYTHVQAIASDTWVIQHDLNKRPTVTVIDSAYSVQLPDDIIYDNENQITLKFLAPFSGIADIN